MYLERNSKVSLSLVLIVFLLQALSVSATTYYVDAAAGKDKNSGTSTTVPWQTLAKVNATKFSPGDQILLLRGRTWHEGLLPASSGSPGHPITFGAYGMGVNPIIDAADLATGWTPETGFVYRASLPWAPYHVWQNGALLTSVVSLSALTAAGEWYYSPEAATLYVWSTSGSDPGQYLMEADHRSTAINIMNQSYITITGLTLTNSTGQLVNIVNGSNIVVSNCILKNARGAAIAAFHNSPNLLVDRCNYSVSPGYQGRSFVWVQSTTADGPIISNNTVGSFGGIIAIAFEDVNNAQVYGNTVNGNGCGIELMGIDRNVTGADFHDNAIFSTDKRLVDGESIKIRGNGPNNQDPGAPRFSATAKVYRNFILGGPYTTGGIDGWYATQNEVYSNIIMNVTNAAFQWTEYSPLNYFYNNTVYNKGEPGTSGFEFASGSTGQIVANNIVKGTSYGIAADPVTAPTIIEDYNILDVTTTVRQGLIRPGTHTLTVDPMFVSASPATSNDLKLQSTSPAIESGENKGSPYNWILDPRGKLFPYPAVDQNTLGSQWERGAFAY